MQLPPQLRHQVVILTILTGVIMARMVGLTTETTATEMEMDLLLTVIIILVETVREAMILKTPVITMGAVLLVMIQIPL